MMQLNGNGKPSASLSPKTAHSHLPTAAGGFPKGSGRERSDPFPPS